MTVMALNPRLSVGSTFIGGTAGSVLFIGAGGIISQDNANFFWDNTNNFLGIGTNAPTEPLHVVNSAANGICMRLNESASSGTGYGAIINSEGAATLSVALRLDAANSSSNYGLFINSPVAGATNFAILSSATAISSFAAGVVIGNTSMNANAILDLQSTTKAFMPPRMTETQRDNIASPTAGMVIYNTTTNLLNFYNGAAWGAV